MEPDPVFDEFVNTLSQQCRADEENHRPSPSPPSTPDQILTPLFFPLCSPLDVAGQTFSQGVFNQPWRGTSQYRFPILPWAPDQMDDIKERWAIMRGQKREQQYLRHLAIESNLIEMTFSLTSSVSAFLVAVLTCDVDDLFALA